MNGKERTIKTFVGYDYKEVVANSEKASFLLDCYGCFGWEQDENIPISNKKDYKHPQSEKVVLRLKRNRKIVNKMELTRLQRNLEAHVNEIEMLENAKTSKATMYSLIVGILGTAFMAGSVFAITAPQPYVLLCILFAIPAFIGWITPYFIYKKMVSKETERITPLIEEKYDEIYEICEKGNKILM